nr:MAG TPA: hypothetical protein [Inoviridae sp.]
MNIFLKYFTKYHKNSLKTSLFQPFFKCII